jgi:hypothetical protein
MIILEMDDRPDRGSASQCRLICGVKRHFSTTVMSIALFALLLRNADAPVPRQDSNLGDDAFDGVTQLVSTWPAGIAGRNASLYISYPTTFSPSNLAECGTLRMPWEPK